MNKIRVGITMGDPSGIGPEIILKALSMVRGLAEFVVIADKWIFNQVPGARCQVPGAKFVDLNNVDRKNFKFGKVRAEYGRASLESLDKALELIKDKQIDCLVTCPISKEAVNKAGFTFSGHTEYFMRRTHKKNAVMMLLNKELKFSLLTRHIPLREVSMRLSRDMIKENILLTRGSLKLLFGIRNPRLVVCGLNPHASDNGFIGNEEGAIIRPALDELRKKIKYVEGPVPADTAILKSAQNKYDCVIAMYHDQALIALKLSDPWTGVNLTLGLPFIRTSPLHGTAFDIAGKGIASPLSLTEAIKLSILCAVNQKRG